MQDSEQKISFRNILRLSGAFAAGGIGCGFATGQEVMQFFTAQGIMGIAGVVVSTIFFSWMGALFMRHGYNHSLDTPVKTFEFYYGERIGRAVELLVQVFIFGTYVIMVSGGGSILHQCFGVPQTIGRTVLIVLGFFTVCLGLVRFLDLISFIGTALAVLTVIVGIVSFIPRAGLLPEMAQASQSLEITKTSGGWLWSAILYPSFNSLAIVILSCRAGCEAKSSKEATLGGLIGGILFGLAIFAQNLGLLANIKTVFMADIPTVALVATISPVFESILAITIFIGIYSAGIPMLWSIGAHFAEDRTRRFTLVTLALSVLAFILGSVSNFKSLINTIYPASGYLALTLLVLMAYRDFKDRRSLKP